MKKKKGFTIVELLGVIVILAIVLGIVSIAFININNSSKKAYYKTLEESILLEGNEYFAYNKDNQPLMFGDENKIGIKYLIDNKYLTDVIDRKGNACNLDNEKSYVGAYKDSFDKTNYYVCLYCDDDNYKSENPACDNNISYSLQMIATRNDTSNLYKENSWIKGYVTLTFKTFNKDITSVEVINTNTNSKSGCNLNNNTCNIKIDTSGSYEAYGISSNNNKTRSEKINILVDNTGPNFKIRNNSNNNQIVNLKYTDPGVDINDLVSEIEDLESGIKEIKYSFEKDNTINYKTISPTLNEFTVSKTLSVGIHKLIVEVTDTVGNTSKKTVEYNVYNTISKPDSTYCNNLTYNGSEQTLVNNTSPIGFTFSNIKGTNATSYTITATLKENYRWLDESNIPVSFTCTINRLATANTGTCKNLTYNGSTQTLINLDGSNVDYSNFEGKDAKSYTITVTADSNYTFSDGNTSKTLNCSIGKKTLTVTPNSGQSKTYGASDPTFTYSYSGNVSGETPKFSGAISRNSGNNAGTYAFTVGTLALTNNSPFLASNYSLSFSSTQNFTINKKNVSSLTVTLGTTSYTYDGTAKTPSVTVKDGSTTLSTSDYTISYSNNKNVGTATVTITGNGNYTGTTSKTFTINKRPITIAAVNQTITYGNSINKATSYITSNNLASGHSVTAITLTQSTTNATTSGTITPSAATIKSGEETVTSNYSITYTKGTLIINRLNTAKVATCKNLTYNGSTQTLINLDGSNVDYSNFEGKDAKSYTITVTADSNHTFSDGTISKNINCSIGKKTLTVTPNSGQSKTYGASDPTFTYSYSGNVSGETPKFSGAISRNSGNNAGTYAFTVGTLALTNNSPFLASNYSLSFSSTQNFTINKKSASSLTVALGTTSYTYDGTAKTPSVTVKDGSTTLTLNTNYSVSYSSNKNAGTATVTITGSGNYTGTTSKTFTISKRAVTITAKAQSLNGITTITTGTGQITSSGLASGHSVTSITLTQSTTSDTTSGTITPSAAVIKSGSTDVTSNYSITYTKGNLTIVTKKYCMDFHKNGASQIGGSSDDVVTKCCTPGAGTSCTVTTPTITPITDYVTLGWNTSSTSTSSKYSANSSISLTQEEGELFAITRSSDASRRTNYITFKLNGADSFTYNGTKYTADTRLSCLADYGYNGEAIPDSCTITLPTIARSGGKVYGWASDNNSLTGEYAVSSSFTVFDEITLNAITSRTIKLTIDGNGGTTTIGTLTGEAYNLETSAGFIIPSYDNANMCRMATNYTEFSKGSFSAKGYVLGYKYIGLTDVASSKTVKYCQGNFIELEQDTTLYAIWNEDYARTLVTSGDQLNLRKGCGKNYGKNGDSMSGNTTIYVTSEGSKYSSGYMGYWIKYGSRSGCASSMYLRKFSYYPQQNSCSRTDYVCNGGTAADLTLTPSVLTLNLKKSDQTSGTINIDNRCGSISSTTSSNTSLVKVSRSGDVITATAVSGSVAENQQKTATVTVKTKFANIEGCTSTTSIVVKNTLAVAPEVNISTSASTSCGTNCYKKGVTFTVTCSSPIVPITEFTVSGATITGDDYNKTATISYGTTGSKTIKATCTNQEGTTTKSKSISVKVYSSSSACSCKSYSYTCTCGYASGASCKTKTASGSSGCSSICKSSVGSTNVSNCGYSTVKSSCSARNSCWHT